MTDELHENLSAEEQKPSLEEINSFHSDLCSLIEDHSEHMVDGIGYIESLQKFKNEWMGTVYTTGALWLGFPGDKHGNEAHNTKVFSIEYKEKIQVEPDGEFITKHRKDCVTAKSVYEVAEHYRSEYDGIEKIELISNKVNEI